MAGTASNYALDILSCPPSGSIKSVVYSSPTKMCVVEGASTLMCIDLKDFFVPVNNAQQTTFTLPGTTGNYPLAHYSFDYCGMDTSGMAKFAAFFPQYGSKTPAEEQYVEWAFSGDFDGPLYDMPSTLIDNSGLTSGSTSSDTGYLLNKTNKIQSFDGTTMGFLSTDAFAISTRGGLKLWSEIDKMVLFNTFNSLIPSNDVRSTSVSPTGIWVATSNGVTQLAWNNNSNFSFSTIDSPLSADSRDVFYSDGLLAIATAKGISLYDTVENTWENFSKTNVNAIRTDDFNSVFIDSGYLVAGSDIGVYVYDMNTKSWKLYSSAISGWTLADQVNAIAPGNSGVYVGTTDGLLHFEYGATSCSVIPLPGSLIGYESVSGLEYESSSNTVYVSSTGGAISWYDITNDTWPFSQVGTLGSLYFESCNSVHLDGYVYFTSNAGFGRLDLSNQEEDLPTDQQNADILFTYPVNGTYPVSLGQKIYVELSKDVDTDVLSSHARLSTLSGTPVSFSIGTTQSGLYEITPNALNYATGYEFKILAGLTAEDSTYFSQEVDIIFYTQEITPINGWHTLGKQMVLSGTDNHLVSSIVLRNPQSFDVNVKALVAV